MLAVAPKDIDIFEKIVTGSEVVFFTVVVISLIYYICRKIR